MTTPLILTLAFHPEDQARFEALRRAHFPPERNLVPAHLTLFHHLPGDHEDLIQSQLGTACGRHAPAPVHVTGLRSLGRGVAYTVDAPHLSRLRTAFAQAWHEHLGPQDRQTWRPHITIQNKAAPADAARLLMEMQAGFTPFEARSEGLLLWRYLGGPWEQLAQYRFQATAA